MGQNGQTPLMTDKEIRCFRAIQAWARRAELRRLKRGISPKLPYYALAKQASPLGRLVYALLILALSPALLLVGLCYVLYKLATFPHRYVLTYFTPQDLRAPGERNIQGMYHAFSRHMDLPFDLYIACIDNWVSILYGDSAAKTHSMENYLKQERSQLDLHESVYGSGMNEYLRTTINIAREQLSQALGHYP